MTKVAAYILGGNNLAKSIVPHMVEGAKRLGYGVSVYTDKDFLPEHTNHYDAAVFWGYVETCQAIMAGYRNAGKAAVYLDLAYWERTTNYKVSVNARHPTLYFQNKEHDSSRRAKFVRQIRPWTNRESILVAGLSPKGAWAEKLEPAGSWEQRAITEIRKHTNRPIIYRPKPTWANAPGIPGTTFSGASESPWVPLSKSFCVVTYHSNVAVDGLIEGVPCFAWNGVASVMGLKDLSKIEEPVYPGNREQFINDVAYCQWSIEEMRKGLVWVHLKNEGLVA